MTDGILEAALEYLKHGLCIYPVSPFKRPLVRRWNGTGAFRDSLTAERYFAENPKAQIGAVCGLSDLAVIDIDPRNGGNSSFRSLCDEVGLEAFENAAVVRTPGGGQHLYFRAGNALKSSTDALGRGIDVKARGGGVVLPPSRGEQGLYTWRTPGGAIPDFGELPELPQAVVRRLRINSVKTVAGNVGGRLPQVIPLHRRNDTLMRCASKLRWREGFSEVELVAALQVLNERCEPPLDKEEIVQIAHSISKRPASDVDPIIWLREVLPLDLKPTEVRVATALAVLADFLAGDEFTPAAPLIERRTGLRAEKYYQARSALERRGVLKVHSRLPDAPMIELVYPTQEHVEAA